MQYKQLVPEAVQFLKMVSTTCMFLCHFWNGNTGTFCLIDQSVDHAETILFTYQLTGISSLLSNC